MTRIARFKPRDYQIDAVYDALRYNRCFSSHPLPLVSH